MAYKNGDVVFAEDINKAINDSTTAVNTANTAKTASDKASADVIDLGEQIGTKQGTTVTVGGIAQNAIAFTDDPQAQIDNKADGIFFNNGGELKTITIPNSLSNTFCFRQIGIVTLKDAADTVLLTISAKSFFIQRRTDVAVVVEFNENNVKTTHLTNINQLYLELKAAYGFVQIMEN